MFEMDVTIMVCHCYGLSPFGLPAFQPVAVSVCHRFGLFKMDVAVMVCRRSGWSPFQGLSLKWLSPLWFVAVSVCRRSGLSPFRLSPFRFVAVLTHPLKPINRIIISSHSLSVTSVLYIQISKYETKARH